MSDGQTKQDGSGAGLSTPLSKALLCGTIKRGQCMDWRYDTIKLVQPNGYEIDLLLRFIEWAGCHDGKASVRYWVTDKPTRFDDAQAGFLKTLYGNVDADCEASEYSYSEYTSGVDYDSELKIGGHDLLAELQGREGQWLWIEITHNDMLTVSGVRKGE